MTKKELYLDKDHNIVSEEQAKWKVIHEYDKDGRLIDEIWILIEKVKGKE